jgi:asparagine synthase (glutamine-hydrolysing)
VPIEADGYRRRAALRADLPELPSDALGESLLAAMHDRGLHVALTGVGGDFGFAGSLLHYADLLQARDFIGLARQWRADRRTPDVGWSSGQLFSQGVRLMLPDAARRAARPLARRLGFGITVPPWLDRAFAARTNLLDRLGAPRSRATSAPPSRQHVCELFESGWTSRLLESSDRAAAEHGIELRHPFYDRRLVEFAIAIPESQRWRARTTKFVMRHAMRRLLPESVYARMGKADASAFVPHAVDVLGGESALHRLHLARLGWVRADVLVETYRRAIGLFEEGDDRYCSAMFNVWMALAVDAWYRATFVEDSSHERLTERRRPDQGGGNTSGSDGWQPAPEALSVARAR